MQPSHRVGLSGIALYVPPYRVRLKEWCDWYQQPYAKIENVIGRGFRMRGPRENVYTMAASAVLRLIEQYDIDPRRVRYLALGTESSTDNAAGTVAVKGLVNRALVAKGEHPLGRHCEVPEFKHACLGGVYGLKSAVRFLRCEERDCVAIVVSSDVAEYSRGSTGEPTQGAGAVAMLLEKEAQLMSLHPEFAGSSSAWRQIDFRKPMARIVGEKHRRHGQLRDFPVFNGRFSTTCYLDATLSAVDDLLQQRARYARGYLDQLAAVFMHRPYRKMPEDGLALVKLRALADGSAQDREEFSSLAGAAGVDAESARSELSSSPDLDAMIREHRISDNPYRQAQDLARFARRDPAWMAELQLGSELMTEIGNLYTAALPAWIAAGMEDAMERRVELAGRECLLIGYGSGDASEAMPAIIAAKWLHAAERIGFASALEQPADLTNEAYEALHDRGELHVDQVPEHQLFWVQSVGTRRDAAFADFGVEYYGCRHEKGAVVEPDTRIGSA